MRQFKFLVLAMSVGFVGAAHAAHSESEFWYQPKGGQSAVKLEAATNSSTMEVTNLDGTKAGDLKMNSSPMTLSYEYGLNDKNSFGAYVGFGSRSLKGQLTVSSILFDIDNKYTGMSDIHLTYKGNLDGALYYGADLTLGMSKSKEPTSTKNGDNANGGFAIEPYVGYHMGSYGVKLAYLLNMERTSTDQGNPEVESKITGGNALALTPYYELNYGPGAVDFYFKYISTGDRTSTPKGGTATTSGGSTAMSLGASGNYEISSAVALLYEANYTMVNDFSYSTSVKKGSTSSPYLGAGVRMTF